VIDLVSNKYTFITHARAYACLYQTMKSAASVCDGCQMTGASGTCSECKRGAYCSAVCYAQSVHTCTLLLPLAVNTNIQSISLGFEFGNQYNIFKYGKLVIQLGISDFIKLKERAKTGHVHMEYIIDEYSIHEDKMIYKCFGASKGYSELYVNMWRPNYAALASEESDWLDKEFESYSEEKKKIYPGRHQKENYRIVWLSRAARHTIINSVNTIKANFDAGLISREESARELIRLNPLSMSSNGLIVAILDDENLKPNAPSFADWKQDPLLYHKGYRRILLDIIQMSQVSDNKHSAVRLHNLMHRWLLVEFGGILSDSTYHATQYIIRASMSDFYNVAKRAGMIPGHSLFTWNRPNRAIADNMLSLLLDDIGAMATYMKNNAAKIKRKYKDWIALEMVPIFVEHYRKKAIFIFEWFGEPNMSLAMTSSYKINNIIGYGICLRGNITPDKEFRSRTTLLAILMHELAHTFDTLSGDANIIYPVDYYKKGESISKPLDYHHSPTFVRAFSVIIDIAKNSGIIFPPGVTDTVRTFEDYAESKSFHFKSAHRLRKKMGLPQEDEIGIQRTRDYDIMYNDPIIAKPPKWEYDTYRDDGNEDELGNELTEAIRIGNMSLVNVLLRKPNVNLAASDNSALKMAILYNNPEVIALLLENDQVIDLLDDNYIEDIMKEAVTMDNDIIITSILFNFDKKLQASSYLNIYRMSVVYKRTKIIADIIEYTDVVDLLTANEIDHIMTEAIVINNLKIVEVILFKRNVKPDAFDNNALKMAFFHKRITIIHLLLRDRRVTKSITAYDTWHILNEAIVMDDWYIIDIILHHPLSDPSKKDNSLLIRAIDGGYANAVLALLNDPRVDPSARDNYTFIRACELGIVSNVRKLLGDVRVNPAAQNSRALVASLFNRHEEIFALLIADDRVDYNVVKVKPTRYVSIRHI
jgi:hypothetical protein